MKASYITLEPWQLLLAAGLILVNILLSLYLRLGLGRSLTIASLRMTVQLILVGYLLQWVFRLQALAIILGLALLMSVIASISAVGRVEYRYRRIWWDSFVAIFSSSALITLIGLAGVVQVDPWYQPQYLFPLLGMVLGNTMTAVSLALDRFLAETARNRTTVEGLLALGASRREAAGKALRDAARAGMIPMINAMMVMGVVSLPGMMTGQILAGAAPMDAVYYQIVIIFMIASSSALAIMCALSLAFRALFDSRHRLRMHDLDTGA